ncbi:ice-binding family protein [Micromonospora pisi]|nr:ice-binding family protein [Micromonospora pisi]
MAGAVVATTIIVGVVGAPAWAQTTVPLGTAETYGVLAGQAVTDVPPPVGPSVINGDLGVWPGTSVTGSPVVNGEVHVGDTEAMQAQADLTTAYNFAAAEPTTSTVTADLGGQTLVTGVYTSPATMSLTGTVTLDGQNDPNSVFIFQAGSDLITAVDSRVSLINGAQACNVFWQVSSSATLNTRTVFAGTILALQSATLGEGATVAGRVLARNGAVTLIHNTITRPFCAAAVAPPTISKAFGDATIPSGGTTSLGFTLTNPNAGTVLTGVTFTDALPAGLVVTTPSGLTGSCGGGTITATAGGGTISLTGATLPAGGSCTFSVNVTGTTSGTKVNTSSPVDSNESGPGAAASATVTVAPAVVAPPTIAKAFDDATIPSGGTTALGFTLTNPNVNTPLTGVTFTDALPAGLVVATPNGLTGSCGGGTITATAGGGTISLTGATLPAGGSCTFSVNVTGTTSGTKVNTSSPVDSNESGPGAAASATVTVAPTVVAPPTIAKAFDDATIPSGGTTSLGFTLTNPNAGTVLTGVTFTDALPAGLVVATPNGLTGSCGGGTITATAGGGTISLTGATLPAGGSCTFSVNVTGTTSGTKVNTSSPVDSNESGPGAAASATVTVAPAVVAPPTIAKAFDDATIPANGTTALSFTLSNPNAGTVLTGVTFTDALPAGLVVATPNGLTGSCGGGTITATAGGGTISLTGATLPAGGSCTFSVNVTGTTSGTKVNTSSPVDSNESGPGAVASASVTVAVVTPPTIAKAFGATTIAADGTTSLSFTLSNPNVNTPLTGVTFTDALPAGLVVATPNGLTGSCGGGTITATAGGGTISLTGATLPAGGSCTFSVNVTGTTSGTKVNTSGPVDSNESGPGTPAAASVTVSVAAAPTFAKAFADGTVPLNGTTALGFTLTNPNLNTTLTGVSFVDNLPAGLVVATPNAARTDCAAGTIVATAGSSSISLFGATLPAGTTCTVSVNVTGTTTGTKVNTTAPITSVQSGPGAPASASVAVGPAVVAAPTISKAFGDATIPAGGTTAVSFTLSNPNSGTALTGVTFTDALPAGLVVATPNGLTGSCGGGTITATAGSGTISLTGATLPANGSCTFSVNVTGTTSGTKVNTSGPVDSNESGPGATASATVTVGAVAAPTIVKAFRDSTISINGTTALGFTLTNPNANTALTSVGFVDNLPTGLVVATPNATQTDCAAGTIVAAPGSNSITLAGASLPANGSCTVSVNVTGKTSGTKVNTTTATSVESGPGSPASASITVRKRILPVTGARSASYATVALTIIGLGAVLIVTSHGLSRRRRHTA